MNSSKQTHRQAVCFFRRSLSAAALSSAALAAITLSACDNPKTIASKSTPDTGQDSQPKTNSTTGIDTTKAENPSPAVPKTFEPFNAVNIWLEGAGTEVFDYPVEFTDLNKMIKRPLDDVFAANNAVYWKDGNFTGKATEGAKREGNTLTYPVRNNKQLVLKFSDKSATSMTLFEAISHCSKLGMRLPTARELLDFCTAGLSYTRFNYPKTGPCANTYLWTTTLDPDGAGAFTFVFDGTLSLYSRNNPWHTRCVGK